MRQKISNTKWKIALLFVGLSIGLIGTLLIRMATFEKQVLPVKLSPQTEKAIVFYRDDCPDCRSVFPVLYYHNLIKQDMIFVNMNQSLNRRYIPLYNLRSVPTIIKNGHHYSGSDKEKIHQFLDSTF